MSPEKRTNRMTPQPNAYSLLDADDSLLAVIDVQDALMRSSVFTANAPVCAAWQVMYSKYA